MYFHVLLETAEISSETHSYRQYYELDKPELDIVKSEIIEPFLRGQLFQFDGYFISSADIKRILIKSTDRSTSELSDYENSAPRARGLIVFFSRQDIFWTDKYAKDITKEVFASVQKQMMTKTTNIPQDEVVIDFDIFLSYASLDQPEADKIFEAIENAGGKAFLAAKSLNPGDDFADEIRNALCSSREIWLLVSPNSLKSDWVISEWGAAWALRKRIVPILFRCAPGETPDRIRRLHCIDFHRFPELIKNRFSSRASDKKRIFVPNSSNQKDQRKKQVEPVNKEGTSPCPNCSTGESAIPDESDSN